MCMWKSVRLATPFLQASSAFLIRRVVLTASGKNTQNLSRSSPPALLGWALPGLLSQSIDEIGEADGSPCREMLVGGQAVMGGVMMRNGDIYGLAVRRKDGAIVARRRPWYSMTRSLRMQKPFVRGFPILLETLVNGIKSLNSSAALSEEASPPGAGQNGGAELSRRELAFSLALAFMTAVALFVVAPHLLSVVMFRLHAGGDVNGLTFHFWDGLFKICIFLAYIRLIALVPEIRAVFAYHGAEHKTIHAFESGGEVSARTAAAMSRLHPRCGTTFLLFVICLSVVLHAVLVPALLMLHTPENALLKHTLTILFKLLLTVPISCLAYELIRYAARMPEGVAAAVLRAPGLALQRLTTEEPDILQLEVAVVALSEALPPKERERIATAPYTLLNGEDAPAGGR